MAELIYKDNKFTDITREEILTLSEIVEPAGATDIVQLGELNQSLGLLLRVAQIINFEDFHRQFGHMNLTPAEFTVLWLLYLNPGVRQGGVGETLHIKPAHMTKLIRKFELDDMVERWIPEDDRRSVCLRLTEKGRGLVEEARSVFLANDQLNGRLSMSEQKTLVTLLRKYAGFDG